MAVNCRGDFGDVCRSQQCSAYQAHPFCQEEASVTTSAMLLATGLQRFSLRFSSAAAAAAAHFQTCCEPHSSSFHALFSSEQEG